MGRRSRIFPGTTRRRRGRGRRTSTGRSLTRWFFWRSMWGQAALLMWAVKTHPLIAAFLTTYVTVWYQSGSGRVAASATPALWGGGCLAWFVYRTHRTGLTVAQSAAQLRRQDRVRRQWQKACDEAGLKTAPALYRWRLRSEGDTVVATVNTSAAGLSHGPILSGLQKMAEVTGGGCRETRMKALGHSGWVELRFHWGDPLDKVIRPNDIPVVAKGMAPIGLSDAGKVAGLPILNDKGESVLLPTLINGQMGSGKSSTLWALLLGFIVQEIPVHVWVGDPAEGVELAALEDALADHAGTPYFKVVRYADNEADIDKMIVEFHQKMRERMRAQKGQRVRAHIPTVTEPVNLLILDEMLHMDKAIKAGKSGPLGQVMFAGRKAAFAVVALTQLSKVDDLGKLRDLFVFRLVHRTVSREATEAALGSGSGWADKAPAHRIPRPAKGVGYMADTEGKTVAVDEAIRFRSVFLEDHQIADIARGDMPSGVERFAREEADPKAFKHVLYRCYDAHMELLYVGETNNWQRRLREHRRRSPWWQHVIEDSEHIVREWKFGPTAKDAEREAKAAESAAIAAEQPLHNAAENQNNPLRIIRGGKGGRAA